MERALGLLKRPLRINIFFNLFPVFQGIAAQCSTVNEYLVPRTCLKWLQLSQECEYPKSQLHAILQISGFITESEALLKININQVNPSLHFHNCKP